MRYFLILTRAFFTAIAIFLTVTVSGEDDCTPSTQHLSDTATGECAYGASATLLKTGLWYITWPDGAYDELTASGGGECTWNSDCSTILGSTYCWPSFYAPVKRSNGDISIFVESKVTAEQFKPCAIPLISYRAVFCNTVSQTTFKKSHQCTWGSGGGDGGSCPSTDCNEGSGFPADSCQWGTAGCPSGNFNASGCCQPYTMSPVLIDVDGSGLKMSSVVDGVRYDFYGIQQKLQISWIARGSTNAWLVLDRNGNGVIDSAKEMFGNISPQPDPRSPDANGFIALAEYDKAEKGGNGDEVISAADAVFLNLRLWQDFDHNGISEPGELHTLTHFGIAVLELDYHESKKIDDYGNQYRYRAKVKDSKGNQLGRWAWDVFLVRQP